MIRKIGQAFVLDTAHTTYAFSILPGGHPEHLYYGRTIHIEHPDDLEILVEKHVFAPGNVNICEKEHAGFSLEDVRLEMSSYGKGDIREPFVEAILYDGAGTLDFRYEDAVITGEKDALDGLPGSYGSAGEVQQLCEKNGISYTECRRWYDGYRQHGCEIYNPESVVKCIRKKAFGSYWGQTSSYEAISDRIRQNFAGTKDAVISMLAGEGVEVNVTRFLNTMSSFHTKDDLFTFLIHLGYLAYDMKDSTCRIPNREVRREWFNAIETEAEYAVTSDIIQSSRQLLADTLNMDEEAVARALDISHIHVTSNRSYNNEDALQSAVYLAYIYALNRYTVIREMTSGKGFADVVFIPFYTGDPALVIELKRNDSAGSALRQIRDRQYYDSLMHYQGNLLFVGISYDEKTKTHTCRIEKFIKQ